MRLPSFLRKHRKFSPRSNWTKISTAISLRFQETRREFHSSAVELLGPRAAESAETDCALTVKSFQLVLISLVLSDREYIDPLDGLDFCDLVWSQVLGTEMPEGTERIKEYRSGNELRLYSFCCQVAKDLTRRTHPIGGFKLLVALLGPFIHDCILAITIAFKDTDAANTIESLMRWVNKQIAEAESRILILLKDTLSPEVYVSDTKEFLKWRLKDCDLQQARTLLHGFLRSKPDTDIPQIERALVDSFLDRPNLENAIELITNAPSYSAFFLAPEVTPRP